MAATQTEASTNGRPKKRKAGRPKNSGSNAYPGLQDDLRKLFTDHPNDSYSPTTVHALFPQTSIAAITYHLKKLREKRIIEYTGERGANRLAPATHRNGTASLAIPAAQMATPRVSPAFDEIVPTDEYTRSHLKRIEARLQEAHEFDIAFLRRLAR